MPDLASQLNAKAEGGRVDELDLGATVGSVRWAA